MFHHNRVRLVVLLAGLAVICHQSAVIDAFSTRTLDHHRLSYLNPQQHASCRSSSSLAAPQNNSNKFLLHGFLDGIFGGGGGESEKDELNAILATYDIKDVSSKDVDTRFESLSDYITNRWIDLFVSGNIKLTTPVKVSKTSESDNDNDNDDSTTTTAVSAKEETVDEVRGCRLVFQKVDTGYKSKGEEKAKGGGGGDDKKSSSSKQRRGAPKQGGVEILVQKMSVAGSPSLRVTARRCEIDEDTMIKEMSEDIIVTELRKAIDVWKKETV